MLTNHWYIACTSRNLRRRPLQVRMLSQNLVLFRIADGSPAALENRCAHRGMPLAAGAVTGDALQCPYHGWCYDRTGSAVRIPAMPDFEACADRASVPAYRCHEQQGYVWVCPGSRPVAERPPELPCWGEPGWTSFRMYNRFEAPVESCLENFLDCPHATFVHRHWFRAPTNREVGCRVQGLDDGAIAEYFDEPREKSVVWSLLSPSRGEMQHTDRYIAPSTSRVDYTFAKDRRYIITSHCTPVDDDSTDVYTTITFRYKIWGPLVRLFFEPLSRRIIAQDVRALRLLHRNQAQYRDRSARIVDQDVLLPHIRRWRKALAAGEKPAGQTGARDVRIII